MKSYALSVNEDDSHFYMTREKSEMNEAHFREFVRQLERLHAPPAKKAEKQKRAPRAKTKPKTKRKR